MTPYLDPSKTRHTGGGFPFRRSERREARPQERSAKDRRAAKRADHKAARRALKKELRDLSA